MKNKKHIVVVEDDKSTQSLIIFKLENSGFQTTTFENGIEAFEYIKKHKKDIDLILLDLMLPKMSGTDILIELRKDAFKHYIPVIILSSLTLEKDVIKHLELGADDYIKKPFSPSELVTRIKKILK